MGKNGPCYHTPTSYSKKRSSTPHTSWCQQLLPPLFSPAYLVAAMAILWCSLPSASSIMCPRQCHCSNLTTASVGVSSINIDCSRGGHDSFVAYSNQLIDEMKFSSNLSNFEANETLTENTPSSFPKSAHHAYPGTNKTIIAFVDLSFNNLSSKEPFAQISWEVVPLKLVRLNLSNNSIENLNFTGSFVNLVHLDLSNNSLYSLHWSQIQEDMPNLKYLHFQNNVIEHITNPENSPPFNLLTLDLSSNHIHNLPDNSFLNFPLLENLNLSMNRITIVDQFAFQGLQTLQFLSLSYNNIVSLDYPVFQNTSLIHLNLNNLPNLSSLHYNTFLGLSQLQILNLSHNPNLQFLHQNLFAPLESLHILDLSGSGVQQLSELTFHNNHQLQNVLLHGIPLLCQCTNAWLINEMNNTNSVFPNISSLECYNQNTNEERSLFESDLSCENVSTAPFHHQHQIELGSMLTLPCKHPESSSDNIIMWITPRQRIFYRQHFHPNASDHLLSPAEVKPDSEFHSSHYWHHSNSYSSELISYKDRIQILSDGSLFIDYILRSDAGVYECVIKNAYFNSTSTVAITLSYKINEIKIYAIIIGLLCALGFFTLNLVYVIISWLARRLINKRRREHIRQMLENLNTYKSTQITRIYANYTCQLNRVRNTYHFQRDRLHKNYTMQVERVKRGCSNQVEKVRENYHNRLTQLREYSSNQIMQIREIANTKIGHIRDYGSLQLDRLRETYKLQQQHILKLLDTMNLDNCRSIVETECMRTESMMYDLDLLSQDEERAESPFSVIDSEYNTASSSPVFSGVGLQTPTPKKVTEHPPMGNECGDQGGDNKPRFWIDSGEEMHYLDKTPGGEKEKVFDKVSNVQQSEDIHHDIEIEMNTELVLPDNVRLDAKEVWMYGKNDDPHTLYTKISGMTQVNDDAQVDVLDQSLSQHIHTKQEPNTMPGVNLPSIHLRNNADERDQSNHKEIYSSEEPSPVKICQASKSDFKYDDDDNEDSVIINLVNADSDEERESTETDTMV